MGLTYSANDKKWNVSYEKTDHPTDKPVYDTMEVWGKQEERTGYIKGQPFQFTVTTDYSVGINKNKDPNKGWVRLGDLPVNYSEKDLQKYQSLTGPFKDLVFSASKASSEIQSDNQINQYINNENRKLNEENEALNANYDKGLSVISSTKGGDYVEQRDKLKALGISNIESNFKTFYKTEKLTPYTLNLEASKPLYGDFDPDYYKKENPEVAQKYADAVRNDDIDILDRYVNEQGFYAWHYATQGKPAGKRGNAPETATSAISYSEGGEDDKNIQLFLQKARDEQLGLDAATSDARFLKIPYIQEQFEKALEGDTYWKDLAKEKFLSIDENKPEEFAALFRLSEREEDKDVAFQYQINNNSAYGITELEDALNQAAGETAAVNVKKFGALTQNVLQDTIRELKKAKAQEQMLSVYRGLGTFGEVMDINKTIADSLITDTGIGGVLAFSGTNNKMQDDLEQSLQGITGVQNNVIYNWQQWFDTTLKDKYGKDYKEFAPLQDKLDVINAFTSSATQGKVYDTTKNEFTEDFLDRAGFVDSKSLISFLEKQEGDGSTILAAIKGEPGKEQKDTLKFIKNKLQESIDRLDAEKDRSLTLSYKTEEGSNPIKIEAQFARDFIDKYLTPRFNTARSMNEFQEYLDVRQEEQNPFQTQDLVDSLSLFAKSMAQNYLKTLETSANTKTAFDADFYFNPEGTKSQEEKYNKQAETVKEEWEKAKRGDAEWKAQAYRYGLDVNNKEDFAKLHYEVKGRLLNFDPVKDPVNPEAIKDHIYEFILPRLENKAEEIGTVFGTFITPEEFADDVLEGVNPGDENWDEMLKKLGLDDFKGSVEEVRNYLIGATRGNSAEDIRKQIKYLNEKRKKPTQELLGVEYIQREEDYKTVDSKEETELYKTFRDAGYKGSEDEFYERFFPDVDRSEQQLLTKAGIDSGLSFKNLDFSDPFSAVSDLEGLFGSDERTDELEEDEEDRETKRSSFFSLGLDDEDETDYKSKTGSDILGEFTSMFMGF